MKKMNKLKFWLFLFLAIVLLSGCGGGSDNAEAPTPSAMPETVNSKKLNIRLQVDGDIPSFIDRFAEVQVVELVNGQMPSDPVVVATTTRTDAGHTQGLTSEMSIPITVNMTGGKEYGARAGVFDSEARGTILLTSECLSAEACRFFTGSSINSFLFKMVPVADAQTFYDKAVPTEIRAKCSIQPNEAKCGVTKTMQYYEVTRDTCFGASWGGCEETKTFRAAADCLQACRKSW